MIRSGVDKGKSKMVSPRLSALRITDDSYINSEFLVRSYIGQFNLYRPAGFRDLPSCC